MAHRTEIPSLLQHLLAPKAAARRYVRSVLFQKPFWKYLGFLIVTYGWSLAVLTAALLLAAAVSPSRSLTTWTAIFPVLAVALIFWAIVRQVPYFTILTLDPPQPRWRESVASMRGNVLRYTAAWLMAMVPIMAVNFLLDLAVKASGVDVHLTGVALGELARRQCSFCISLSELP